MHEGGARSNRGGQQIDLSEGPDELRGVPDLSNGAPENLKWGRSSSEMGSQNREWGSRLRDGEAEKTREENGFWLHSTAADSTW